MLNFAVLGGDTRMGLLARELYDVGECVRAFALEHCSALSPELLCGSLQECLYGADIVLLPVPAERSRNLSAPLSGETLSMAALADALWPGQSIYGGALSEDFTEQCINTGVSVTDLLKREDFLYRNAEITAECALGVFLTEAGLPLRGSRILLTGWGRIAQLLAGKLLALGAHVTAASRNARHRALAAAMGCTPCEYTELPEKLGDCDALINTAPARILENAALCLLPAETPLLELASAPGGFDRENAQKLGLRVIHAPGLPGKYMPRAAAKCMRDCIFSAWEEEHCL